MGIRFRVSDSRFRIYALRLTVNSGRYTVDGLGFRV